MDATTLDRYAARCAYCRLTDDEPDGPLGPLESFIGAGDIEWYAHTTCSEREGWA